LRNEFSKEAFTDTYELRNSYKHTNAPTGRYRGHCQTDRDLQTVSLGSQFLHLLDLYPILARNMRRSGVERRDRWLVRDHTRFQRDLSLTPARRRFGVGKTLYIFVLKKLKTRHKSFALEFTVDRRNGAALNLDRSVAAHEGMQMVKKPDVVPRMDGSDEELYVMTYENTQAVNDRAFECLKDGEFVVSMQSEVLGQGL
jgi:GNAT superfamily N-acetyltransferase